MGYPTAPLRLADYSDEAVAAVTHGIQRELAAAPNESARYLALMKLATIGHDEEDILAALATLDRHGVLRHAELPATPQGAWWNALDHMRAEAQRDVQDRLAAAEDRLDRIDAACARYMRSLAPVML